MKQFIGRASREATSYARAQRSSTLRGTSFALHARRTLSSSCILRQHNSEISWSVKQGDNDVLLFTSPRKPKRGTSNETNVGGQPMYMLELPATFLRDQCPCETCVHPDTKQRQVDVQDVSSRIASLSHDAANAGDNVCVVEWTDGHKSVFDSAVVLNHFFDAPERSAPVLWDEIPAEQFPPTVDFNAVMASDAGMGAWMQNIRSFGFSFVDNCPKDPASTEALLLRIGPIRHTHYGGFYDFTADLSSKDTAYTNLALPVHTDTTYFTDPAGLQMFHMLSHSGGQGGSSQLVDGFAAARQLFNENRRHYDALSKTRMWYHASGNEGVVVRPATSFPTLEHTGDENPDSLYRVRWNNSDRAEFDTTDPFEIQSWFEAARHYRDILDTDAVSIRYDFQLTPGKPLIFDNWRVLHGRSSFTGKRRMCGGYVNNDDFMSRWRTTRAS